MNDQDLEEAQRRMDENRAYRLGPQRHMPESKDGWTDIQEQIEVSVLEMKTSSIPDYYVSIRCGDRELTPYRHTVKGRAEFSAAEFQWLFHGGEKPNLADWLDRT